MNKTAIEWCDYTWNPVTGCLHGCEYCYARKIARRFGERDCGYTSYPLDSEAHLVSIDMPIHTNGGRISLYPYGFNPTFHKYRLSDPALVKTPSTIFVCSMADLFGDWVPDEWIQRVFEACEAAPWHKYLFLTKNWMRACEYRYKENWWIGRTITHDEPHGNSNKNLYLCYGVPKSAEPAWRDHPNNFTSIEPIHSAIPDLSYYAHEHGYKWAILGAETGNRKGKVIPRREWIEDIVRECRNAGVPVFMKNSLAGVWGDELIQEFPEGLEGQGK